MLLFFAYLCRVTHWVLAFLKLEMHEAVAMMNVTKIHIDEGRGGATNITPEI